MKSLSIVLSALLLLSLFTTSDSVLGASNTKLKKCKPDAVLLITTTKKSICVSENTAKKLVQKGMAKFADVEKKPKFNIFREPPVNATYASFDHTAYGQDLPYDSEHFVIVYGNYSNPKWGISFPEIRKYEWSAQDGNYLKINLDDVETYINSNYKIHNRIKIFAADNNLINSKIFYSSVYDFTHPVCPIIEKKSNKTFNTKNFEMIHSECSVLGIKSSVDYYLLENSRMTYVVLSHYYNDDFSTDAEQFIDTINFSN